MMDALDRLLNRITMYRLVFYVLLTLVGLGAVFAFMGRLPFSDFQLIISSAWLVTLCWLVNRIFAWAFHAPTHNDSAYITGFILTLIITPLRSQSDLALLIWTPILAMSSKYILAWRRQHIFNPAAVAVAITSLVIAKSASWWVGTPWMLGPALIGGFLVVRKVRRFEVVTSYLAVVLIATAAYALIRGTSVAVSLKQTVLYYPVVFFSTIMLIEPSTMPPTRRWRILFSAAVGLLSTQFVHLGSFYFTPELALLSGNLLGWLVSQRQRYILTLREKFSLAPTIMELVFDGPRRPTFRPGQYLEWSLPHAKTDGRGSRRYFTIASSPTERGLRLGIKQYQPMSSYKQTLVNLQPGQTIIAEQLDGDFVLPRDRHQPLVFIAGGIGITPFRSMLKYLLDRQEARPMTLFFANQTVSDIVYTDIIEQAEAELGLKTVYILSDLKKIPAHWTGQRGFITAQMIQQEIPNYSAARFYLSGPQGMVTAYVRILKSLGIPNQRITTDYFPGFAR